MTTKTTNLLERLRGNYTIPVNDGAGPLNDSDTFTRQFPAPPIQLEAATKIERLTRLIHAILHADERGQGINFTEAMQMAAKETGYGR